MCRLSVTDFFLPAFFLVHSFFSFPIVFGSGGYDYNDGLVGLTFIPVFIGLAGALFVTPYLEKRYLMDAKENGGHAEPESRLPGMMLGSLFIPICELGQVDEFESGWLSSCIGFAPVRDIEALFIFGWTAPPYVMPHGGSWVGPCSAGELYKILKDIRSLPLKSPLALSPQEYHSASAWSFSTPPPTPTS